MDKRIAPGIIGGNSAAGRRKSDFYPTPPDATIALLKYLRLLKCTRIWEPAAGEGDMAEAMRERLVLRIMRDVLRKAGSMRECGTSVETGTAELVLCGGFMKNA